MNRQKLVPSDRANLGANFSGYSASGAMALEGSNLVVGAYGNDLDENGLNKILGTGAIYHYAYSPCAPALVKAVDSTICFGDSIYANGVYVNTTGVYNNDTLKSVYCCDSVIYEYTLTVLPQKSFNSDTVYAEEGSSILVDGVLIIENTTLSFTLPYTGFACDSIDVDTVVVFVSTIPPLAEVVVVPNVFTPNGDDVNDLFVIQADHLVNSSLQIFNRWGVSVYEGDLDKPWDGKSGGSETVDGTYFVLLKGENAEGLEYEYSENFTLKR